MRKVKKDIYYQKYKEARELTKQQQIHEESGQSSSDSDDNDDDESEDERIPNA